MADHASKVREILIEVLEIEPHELTEDGSFVDDYGADSLRAVEILASLEKAFSITIPEAEMSNMTSYRRVKEVLTELGCPI